MYHEDERKEAKGLIGPVTRCAWIVLAGVLPVCKVARWTDEETYGQPVFSGGSLYMTLPRGLDSKLHAALESHICVGWE